MHVLFTVKKKTTKVKIYTPKYTSSTQNGPKLILKLFFGRRIRTAAASSHRLFWTWLPPIVILAGIFARYTTIFIRRHFIFTTI